MNRIYPPIITAAILLLSLSGCLSEKLDAPRVDPSLIDENKIRISPGEGISWNWSGLPGTVKGFILSSLCPNTELFAEWDILLDAQSTNGLSWIIGPSPIVNHSNSLPTLRTRVHENVEGAFEEKIFAYESGSMDRSGLLFSVGSESAWASSGTLRILEAKCNWEYSTWTSDGAKISLVHTEVSGDSGGAGVGFNFEVEGEEWTHVYFQDFDSDALAMRLFRYQFPNGFVWADQHTREDGGVTGGPQGNFVGAMHNSPGTIRAVWLDSSVDLTPKIYVIQQSNLEIPSNGMIGNYCASHPACREFNLRGQ